MKTTPLLVAATFVVLARFTSPLWAATMIPPVDDGLVAWYRFETGADQSGNGNNLTVTYPAGSVTFNDAESYVSLAATATLQAANTTTNILGGTGFTISLWYYNVGATNASTMHFARKWISSGGVSNKSYWFNYNNGKYDIYLQGEETAKLISFAADVPTQAEWTYISLVYDGADNGNVKLYLAEQGDGPITTPYAHNASGLSSVGDGSTATFYLSHLNGNLSGYALYDRALSTEEVNTLYLSGRKFEAIPEGQAFLMLGIGITVLGVARWKHRCFARSAIHGK